MLASCVLGSVEKSTRPMALMPSQWPQRVWPSGTRPCTPDREQVHVTTQSKKEEILAGKTACISSLGLSLGLLLRSVNGPAEPLGPFEGPLGIDFDQHRQTLRPSADGVRSKALRPRLSGGKHRPITVLIMAGVRPKCESSLMITEISNHR